MTDRNRNSTNTASATVGDGLRFLVGGLSERSPLHPKALSLKDIRPFTVIRRVSTVHGLAL